MKGLTTTGQGSYHLRWLVGAVALLAVGPACSRPTFEGPQIQDPPDLFIYDANASQGRNIFPQRQQLRQGAWFSGLSNDDEHSSIFITTHAGPSSRNEIEAGRDAQANRYGGLSMQYSPIGSIWIDGRTAWGWTETQVYRGKIASLEYKAVVSYDTVSYAIEFHSSQPEWMNEQKLKAVVATFAVGRTELNVPAIIVLVVVGMAVQIFWSRRKQAA